MPPLKLCANLSWLFTDLPEFTQRIYAAASAGFQAVEAAWLYDSDLQELQRVKNATGVDVVLINTPLGDAKAGDLGLGAVPGREEDFRKGLDLAMQYAKALDCRRIHLMAGRVPVGADRATIAVEMEDTFVQNLKHAADVLSNVKGLFSPGLSLICVWPIVFVIRSPVLCCVFFSQEGITGLIEPINTRITDPRYFLDSPHQAAAILQKVGHPNIKLQMDVFHWQIMDNNLTQNIHKYFPLIGHIQIAQVPGRNEPDSAGELNFPYLFSLLEEMGYQGYIGCEYKPLGSTNEGLGWVKDYLKRNR